MALSSVFVFTIIMVFCTVCGAIPFQKAQVDGGPVVLADTGSKVVVTCKDGFVTLSLSDTLPDGHTARIRIGPEVLPVEENRCWSGGYEALPMISTSTDKLCDRTEVDPNDRVYKWAVRVEEQIILQNSPIAKVFPATFTVQCAHRAAVPLATAISLPDPVTEGLAQFTATPIAFRLTKDMTNPSSRDWTLTLGPEDANALQRRQYVLTTLTATPTGAGGEPTSFAFIDNGCIINDLVTKVARDTDSLTYTITMRAFQFIAHPGKGVDFAAGVRLCAVVTDCVPLVPVACSSRTSINQPDFGKTQKRLSHSDIRMRQTGSNTVTIL